MSRQTNNNKDQKLKALLDQQASHQEPEDGFEKEAREGFAMLEGPEAAFDLKADLDEKIGQTLFSRKHAASTRSYWMAAAGLVLAIGISAYFILASEKNQMQEMAVAESIRPNYDSIAAPVAAEHSYEEKAAVLESAPASRNSNEMAGYSAKTAPAPDQQAAKAAAPAKEANMPQAEVALAPKGTAGYDALPSNSKDEEELAEKDADKMSEKEIKADDDAKPLAVATEKKIKESKKRAKQAPTYTLNATASSPVTISESSASYNWEGKKQMADSVASQNCYYEGGDAALHKQLTQRLKEKGLDRHFAATLFIAFNARVSKVEFTGAKGISEEEQNEITYVIQSLDQFRFRNKPGKAEVAEYKIKR